VILGLEILAVVAALAIGIWLGLPGRYTQTPEDIEAAMARGSVRRRRVKRDVNPLAWLQRRVSVRPSRSRARGRGSFDLERPEDR